MNDDERFLKLEKQVADNTERIVKIESEQNIDREKIKKIEEKQEKYDDKFYTNGLMMQEMSMNIKAIKESVSDIIIGQKDFKEDFKELLKESNDNWNEQVEELSKKVEVLEDAPDKANTDFVNKLKDFGLNKILGIIFMLLGLGFTYYIGTLNK